MLRRIIFISIVLAVGLLFNGSSIASQPTRIKALSCGGPAVDFWLQESILDFTQQTDVEVEFSLIRPHACLERIIVMIAAGETIDVVLLHGGRALSLAADISDFWDLNAPVQILQELHEEGYPFIPTPGSLQFVSTKEEKFGLVGIPLMAEEYVLVYREDLFAEKGLRPPSDWKTLLEAAQAFANDEVKAISISPSAYDPLFKAIALSNGVKFIPDEEGGLYFDPASMADAMQFYATLGEYLGEEYVVDTWWESYKLYDTGKVAAAYIPLSLWFRLPPEIAEKSGIISVFSGPKRSVILVGDHLLIGITAKARPEAKEFVKSLLRNYELLVPAMVERGYIPALRLPCTGAPCEDPIVQAWKEATGHYLTNEQQDTLLASGVVSESWLPLNFIYNLTGDALGLIGLGEAVAGEVEKFSKAAEKLFEDVGKWSKETGVGNFLTVLGGLVGAKCVYDCTIGYQQCLEENKQEYKECLKGCSDDKCIEDCLRQAYIGVALCATKMACCGLQCLVPSFLIPKEWKERCEPAPKPTVGGPSFDVILRVKELRVFGNPGEKWPESGEGDPYVSWSLKGATSCSGRTETHWDIPPGGNISGYPEYYCTFTAKPGGTST